jgi:acyl-CoA synthetase (AMP-forming)/AMP-acid ligase II
MYPGRHAVERPDDPAVIMAGSGQVITYGSFDQRCNQVAHFLRSCGMKSGDHLSVFSENHPSMLEIEGGAERTGIYFTLINSRLAPDEVAYIITNSRSRLFFSTVARRDVAVAATAKCPQLERQLMVGLPAPDGKWEPFSAAVDAFPITPVEEERLGGPMLYSSGTTGQPKGVFRPLPDQAPDPHPTVLGLGQVIWRMREGMVYLNPAPLYHSAPQTSVAASIRLGAKVVVMEHFDPEEWMALVERHRVTHCQMVPTMFNRLLRLPEEIRAKYDLSSLEVIIHAAAPCPVPIKRAMIEWLGPILLEYYAATEGNGLTLCSSEEWLAHPGTVGRSLVGELLILDENGNECPTGVDGTVYFKGATNFEYFDDPAKTAGTRSADGMASTVGDVGHADADGFLYLTDRKSYMIISGGVNIYPQETENLLVTHPAVLDAAVIGVPNEDLGEEVKAIVQLADPSQASDQMASELIAFCRANLAHFKCPRTVDFMEELPRSETGKLYKRLLRDRYWEGHQTSIL